MPTDLNNIKDSLHTVIVGSEIVVFDEAGSTNDLAKRYLENNAPEGLVIVADSQTQGRGRMGRVWHSEKGVGIYFSLVLKPQISPALFPKLTLMAAVAVVQSINAFSKSKASLKWPNDILLNNRKVCGILSEYHAKPRGAIIGIGVNVNQTQFPEPLKDIATSLRIANQEAVDRLALLRTILTQLDREYIAFINDKTYPLAQKWMQNSEMFGKEIVLTHGKEKVKGIAVGLDASGKLLVRVEDGKQLSFDSGEVTSI